MGFFSSTKFDNIPACTRGAKKILCKPKHSLVYRKPWRCPLRGFRLYYKGQESRPFASTTSREHRPPGCRSSTAEITLRGARHPSQPRSCSLKPRAGREHGPLVYITRRLGDSVYMGPLVATLKCAKLRPYYRLRTRWRQRHDRSKTRQAEGESLPLVRR